MDIILENINLDVISLTELMVRILMAVAFGLILGLDRDTKNKPIDFRAYIIVAVTTCVVAIMGQELYQDFQSTENFISLDLGKIISGALTGIGFLGAGAIIHQDGNKVVGTATGASIWAAGGIGLVLGFGFYLLAFVAFLAVAVTLIGRGAAMSLLNGKADKEEQN